MTLEQGTRLGHYEIVSVLGRGGMGEVYLADDGHLDRRVALKILPADAAADHDRLSRFVREAKAASALNHPNIITVFDIGEAAGLHFIAYEFVDGQTLRGFALRPSSSLAAALDIAIQIASALVEAHAAGIVHRDLKPDNVMVRASGLVKLLDFGIARLSTPPPSGSAMLPAQTQTGVLIGTPQFMSPEQARGLEVDHQTDIFSFGVVFYEMLSGVSPFAAATVADVIAAVLTRGAAPLPHLPGRLAGIVSKALEKERARRYPTATDLLRDLTACRRELDARADAEGESPALAATQILPAVTPPVAVPTPPANAHATSIAVLPFVNIGADEENEFFAEGLAEELLNALSRIPTLKVASRSSAFSFKGKRVDLGTIARTLGVGNVLEGSIRRSGHRLRITVQMSSAADGCQVWSERYDREWSDIFALQDDITLAVVEALKVTLFGDARAAVLKRATDSAEAYELFLKGRYQSYKYTALGWSRAIAFYEKAIAVEPDYALAYAGLAASRGCLWYFGILPADATIPQCRAAYRKALSIDPNLADAHLPQAIITFFYDWQWAAAEQEFQRAITLNPQNAEALSYYALFLAFDGRADDATRMTRKALGLDPLAPLINMNGGWTWFSAGMPDEASRQAARMIDSDPDFYGAYWLQGAIDLSRGAFEAAVGQLRTAVALGGHQIVVADLAAACSLSGRPDEAAALLEQLLVTRREQYVPAICLARVYSRLGDTATAIDWLETAFAERNGEMVFLEAEIAGAADGDPLGRLGGEPRVAALLSRMSLPA